MLGCNIHYALTVTDTQNQIPTDQQFPMHTETINLKSTNSNNETAVYSKIMKFNAHNYYRNHSMQG